MGVEEDIDWLLANPDKCMGSRYHDAGSCWQLIERFRRRLSALQPQPEAATYDSKGHMLLILDVDWATLRCTCGQEICSRYESDEAWQKFKEDHVNHTSGFMKEVATTKALAWGNVDPNLRPVLPTPDLGHE
jgi:hypothetical protein